MEFCKSTRNAVSSTKLMAGVSVMLLRNLDPTKLRGWIRLAIKYLQSNVAKGILITGNGVGLFEFGFRPKYSINFITKAIAFWQFKGLQSPLWLRFAKSINKSQVQTIKVFSLQLQDHCFLCGQLFVDCSRVDCEKKLCILPQLSNYTKI